MWILTALLTWLAMTPGDEPVFRFGVVADVQYADKDTAGKRHYRTSLERLRQCVTELQGHELEFVVQLGDLIDEPGDENLDRVLEAVATGPGSPGASELRALHPRTCAEAPGRSSQLDAVARLGLELGWPARWRRRMSAMPDRSVRSNKSAFTHRAQSILRRSPVRSP